MVKDFVPTKALIHKLVRLIVLGVAITGLFPGASITSDTKSGRDFAACAAASSDALTNPLRGYHDWYGQSVVPQAGNSLEQYRRISWAELEPEKGAYNFRVLEEMLRRLKPGQRIAFGVLALNIGWSDRDGLDVPRYLVDAIPKGFWFEALDRNWKSENVYVPDWNDEYFLQRAERLLEALGEKYDHDPRIAWVDIRVYGNWGEWHLSGVPNSRTAHNARAGAPASERTKRRIIDAHVRAFPNTQLLMMSDDMTALLYALSLKTKKPIGIRRDSLGSAHFEAIFRNPIIGVAERELIENRWRVAPIVAEPIGDARHFSDGPENMLRQVMQYHVSTVSNGVFGGRSNWNQFTIGEQDDLLKVGRCAGYAFEVLAAQASVARSSNKQVIVALHLRNNGSAPVYEDWKISYRVQYANGHLSEVVNSHFDLRSVLPGASKFVRDSLPVSQDRAARVVAVTFALSKGSDDPHRMSLATSLPASGAGYRISVVSVPH